jgi:organic hydroperoxide reductase OsmC/OhrA
MNVPLESVETEVNCTVDVRAGSPGFEKVPFPPHDIRYSVSIVSSAPQADIDKLHEAVSSTCPVLSLLRNPQSIAGKVQLSKPKA